MSCELKLAVERAVRPVHAPVTTKRRMREELYALIDDIHSEELARGGTAEEVLARTLVRFGNPAELTQELQASLNWRERAEVLLNRGGLRQAGEPAWRSAMRMAGLMLVATGIPLLLVAVWKSGGRRPVPFDIVGLWTAMMCLDAFVLTWLGIHTADRERRSARLVTASLRAWLSGLAAGLCVGLLGVLVLLGVSRGVPAAWDALQPWAAIAPATAVIYVGVQQAVQWEHRSVTEWEDLDLTPTLAV